MASPSFQPPDRNQVSELVHRLDVDSSGDISISEAKALLCLLLDIPAGDIPDSHVDVIEFAGMGIEAMVEKLCLEIPKDKINEFHQALVKPAMILLPAPPDRDKVVSIVGRLDQDSDGDISASEAKVLLSKLLGIPEEEIPDNHQDLLEFAGLSTDEMVEKLMRECTVESVDQYWTALGLPEPPKGASLLDPPPDRDKVIAILDSLDTDASGTLSVGEVKALFSDYYHIWTYVL